MKKRHLLFTTLLVTISVLTTLVSLAVSNNSLGEGDELVQDSFSSKTSRNPQSFSQPFYVVKENQSIHDIAAETGQSVYDLLVYNQISGKLPLEPEQKIFIPGNMISNGNYNIDNSKSISLPKALLISASATIGTAPLKIKFKTNFSELENYYYIWDFGNNRFAYEPSPECVYTRAGRYTASLTLYNRHFEKIKSNIINLKINKIATDYSGPDYITVDRKGDLINLTSRMKDETGNYISILPGAEIIQEPALIRQIGTNQFIADQTGYSHITIRQNINEYNFYLFVSPFPSKHSAEPEFDWYYTQHNTGMYGNCGPASNSIVIKWATGQSFSVRKVRQEIGMPYYGGGVDYNNLKTNLKRHNIESEIVTFADQEDIFNLIDQGKIMIMVFHCGFIRPTKGDETRVYTGRYYPDSTGHYIVIKGYSLDKKYVIVYDAIPGDWESNSLRYEDGVSMIGRNRYFLVEDLMKSVRIPELLMINRNTEN